MDEKFNLLVTVCARAGSKGLKDKNIRSLCGKPLIAYTVEQAVKWGKFSRLVCSTDSKKIGGIARKYGAEVPFIRPRKLANDTAGKAEVLRHALIETERLYGVRFDALLDLDVTSPVRRVRDIENIVNLFKSRRPDCVFSVVKAQRNPYFNMVEEGRKGRIELCKKLPRPAVRRQDAPRVYDMNASMYVYKREFLMNPKNKMPYSGRSLIYEMPQVSRFDIDNELDFKLMEILFRERLIRI